MSDERTRPVSPIEASAVPGPHAAIFRPQDLPKAAHEDGPAAAYHAATVPAPTEPSQRSTDLAFQVDAESQQLLVHVVDRETQAVVRSFPLQLPGASGAPEAASLGALVDEKV